MTHPSEAIFPTLEVKQGDSVLDIDCDFGDTALKLAERVGPTGRVIGLNCCEAFMEYGCKEVALGPAGEVFREAGEGTESKRSEIEKALSEAIAIYNTATEGIVMETSSWVISAHNPL